MPFRRRPQSLVGILLHTYWTAFADDPLSALLFVVRSVSGRAAGGGRAVSAGEPPFGGQPARTRPADVAGRGADGSGRP